VLQTNRNADNDAIRAGSERILVEGVVNNDSKIIDRSAELGNRSLNIQQDAENRKRQELEYRANAGSQILEMERERQERNLAIQNQYREDLRREKEEQKTATQRQYWSCMNAALDTMSSAAAGARCDRYR
jgi:molecular chaperone GrpE (heat shock protein)